MPGATGYLAEEMVTGAVAEVLLGLRRDPVYGVTLTLGMGGVTAEVLADTVTLVLPATAAEVLQAARRLRLWPLLDGYRGRPKADMAAVPRSPCGWARGCWPTTALKRSRSTRPGARNRRRGSGCFGKESMMEMRTEGPIRTRREAQFWK